MLTCPVTARVPNRGYPSHSVLRADVLGCKLPQGLSVTFFDSGDVFTRLSVDANTMEESSADNDHHTQTRRRVLAGASTAVVTSAVAGCSGRTGSTPTNTPTDSESETATPSSEPSTDTPRAGGVFTYGLSSQPDTMNVLRTGSAYAGVALDLVYERGTTVDPFTYEVRPNVYTDWAIEETSDGGADVYIDVRDGLTWNDGEEFTVDDVLFTYRYLLEHEPSRYVSLLEPIESVEAASGDWDVHLRLSDVISTWETRQVGGVPLLPEHQWAGTDPQTYEPTENGGPVGLGPGRVTTFDPATAMQVTFRDDYESLSSLDWIEEHEDLVAGGPYLDAVNYRIYGSQSALVRAYFQGEVDAVYGSLKPSYIDQAESQEGTQLVDGYSSGFAFFGFNLRRTPFDDITFRQAISMAFDDIYWTDRLQRGYAYDGDYPHPPGYRAVRPESVYDGELLTDPATEAFAFRGSSGVTDIEGIRAFLTDGEVIDGTGGTYVGKEYPGTLSGVTASRSSSRHDYSLGPIESETLREHEGSEQELYVDGTALSEAHGGPISLLMDPPKKKPAEAQMIETWIMTLRSLGVPIEMSPISFNSLVQRVFYEEEYDMFPMAWADTSPYGTHLYRYFHSSRADDHSDGNQDTPSYNATGYGLVNAGADGFLETMRQSLDPEERNRAAAKAIERIYLDCPYMTWYYPKTRWGVDGQNFDGYVNDIASPYYANWPLTVQQLHRTE
ncbi:ABC transporter substrate-binding protein [Halobaculum magnesiiphilum]|uniref:Solute-binding protein family 5 domain-containing protein n=1 Tax=Halobaculum magnesiiphilum TaxID=1017351 RepID=A0A8T8WET8_9EURY|nr:ABC transporter substrate-binding protein [Halobaculum magnesiiphilum]QZP38306.1 hypothetical protein K6T50_03935 [Halobaculum magnesiiphilum]